VREQELKLDDYGVQEPSCFFSCANGWGLIVGLTNNNGYFMGYFGLNGGSCDWSLLVALIFPKKNGASWGLQSEISNINKYQGLHGLT
jgi:cytochrome c oxidase subunit IV